MHNLIYILCLTSILSFNTLAVEPTPTTQHQTGLMLPKPVSEKEFEKVIQEFRQYLEKIDPKVKEEIKIYRNKIQKLNQDKIDLYKHLSEAAQMHLRREREFKKRLPWMERKKLIQAEDLKHQGSDIQDAKAQPVEPKK